MVDPYENIAGASRYLRSFRDGENRVRALAAYNAGLPNCLWHNYGAPYA